MNQLNSCIFEGTMTELEDLPDGVSIILEIARNEKVNGKNIKQVTKVPCFVSSHIINEVKATTSKEFKELVGYTLRLVGRMTSFEMNNGVICLLCIVEHTDVKL